MFGCAGEPACGSLDPALSADSAPADFTLAVTVAGPAAPSDAPVPRSRHAARYVMEADWVLRAAVGQSAGENTFPAQTRQLTAKQVDRLWQDLRDSGLLENPSPAAGQADAVYTIYYVAGGCRGTIRLDRENRSGASRLVDDLAALAWVADR